MIDLSAIPMDEMLRDRFESLEDIRICSKAMAMGVAKHRDGFPVADRIRMNYEIIETIDAEIARRQQPAATAG